MTTALLLSLLLGLQEAATAQTLAPYTTAAGRPAFAPLEGCKPGLSTSTQCPIRMDCYRDANFEKGGRCDCNPLFGRIPKPLLIDDNEFDTGGGGDGGGGPAAVVQAVVAAVEDNYRRKRPATRAWTVA